MRRLDAAARELEAQKRQKAMDISGNKLDLSGEARKNKVIVFKQRRGSVMLQLHLQHFLRKVKEKFYHKALKLLTINSGIMAFLTSILNGCLQLTEGRFVGSIYVGGEEERSEGERDKSNSWRVKL